MYTMLSKRAKGLEKEAVDFARELIMTGSQTLHESDVAGKTESRMKTLGYDRVLRDEFGNVVGLMTGRESSPCVLLVCHMDTAAVAAGTAHKPGQIENGRLYGPGASDCKAGLAAQVYGAELIRRSLLPLKGNLVVAATVAEEGGCSVGVRGLMEKTLPELGLKPDFAILGEPTGLGLYYGHDGWIKFEIQIEGANPFIVDDTARAVFEDLRESWAGGADERALIRLPRFAQMDDRHWATIEIDRRLKPSEKPDDVVGQARHQATLIAESLGSVAVSAKVQKETQVTYTGRTVMAQKLTHAWATDPFNPMLERCRHALAAADCPATPGKWKLGRMGMGTAGGVLVDEFRIPTIGYGPGNEDSAHTADECVEIESIGKALFGTAVMVQALAGVPVFGWTSEDF